MTVFTIRRHVVEDTREVRALGVELPGTTAAALMKVFVNLRSELKY